MTALQPTAPTGARSIWPWLVGGFIALVVMGVFVGWVLTRPVHVVVDGVERAVPARTTVRELRDLGMINTEPGALISVKGKVLRAKSGAAATVTLNGEPAALDRRIVAGDEVVSAKGADTTETCIVVRECAPIEVAHEGVGPAVALRRIGTPDVVDVTKGRVSGTKVARTVVSTGEPMVVVHRPATAADKLVALTFDDGPWPGQTEKILAVLKKQNVHATFFMLGNQARKSPALAKRVADEGHLVGSHSLSHKELTKLKPAGVRKEIGGGVSAIQAATGVRPGWFRPPYGAMNGTVRKEARAAKVRIAMWDIDTLDWTKPGAHMLYRNAVRSTKPGQVVLMHDGGKDRSQTIEALPTIIEDLREKGFVFVTLDELAATK